MDKDNIEYDISNQMNKCNFITKLHITFFGEKCDNFVNMVKGSFTQEQSHHIWFLCNIVAINVLNEINAFWSLGVNPLTAKLFNLNFQSLEVVSRWRDPQLQVMENYSDLTKWRSTIFKYSVKRSDVTQWKQGYITPPPPIPYCISQLGENEGGRSHWVSQNCWLMSHFIFNMSKRWYFMC